jgi:ParB family chromosome partitioning protein
MLQPIILQPWDKDNKKFRIVSGHRRFLAMNLLHRITIPAIVTDRLDELEARKLNLEENLKRKDLNMVQEARAIEPFLLAGWTQQHIAEEFSQPTAWVNIRAGLLRLPSDIQERVAAGFLTQEQVRVVGSMKSKEQQYAAVKDIVERKQRGEKKKIEIVKKKVKPTTKRRREASEIKSLMETIQKYVGNSFVTRALAWSAGEISDYELQQDLVQYCADHGVAYSIPKEMMEAIVNFK